MSVTASWQGGRAAWAVLVHGGAGDIALANEAESIEGCRAASTAAAQILSKGGGALDAVQRAVEMLEDNPLFNAGIGSALNSEGEVELDAAIMEGENSRAGAVCAIRCFSHPISIARAALDDGRHVFYAAGGAERFAEDMGFTRVAPQTLVTERAREKLEKALRGGTGGGTVGAVARDGKGILAAATSTGGTSGKRPGRVGDSPVIGAGTYASSSGAASATGHGEGILRVALGIRAVELLATLDPEAAAAEALTAMDQRVKATGGLILVRPDGRIGWARTTRAMPWAAEWDGGESASGC